MLLPGAGHRFCVGDTFFCLKLWDQPVWVMMIQIAGICSLTFDLESWVSAGTDGATVYGNLDIRSTVIDVLRDHLPALRTVC